MSKGLIDLSRANPPGNPLDQKAADVVDPAPATEADPPPVPPPAPAVAAPVARPATAERVSTIGARIPVSLHQNIKLFCIVNGIEMQQFVQDALTAHLATLQASQQP